MQYYKWMFDDSKSVRRIPGFVFLSIEDAVKFSDAFETWCYGDHPKALFTFKGVEPTRIKQNLNSRFLDRTAWRELSNQELQKAMLYFDKKPREYFLMAVGAKDIPLMLSIAQTVGCISVRGKSNQSHSDIEALYRWPATMTRVSEQEIIGAATN
jgi:hypothetical protein